MPDNLSGKLRKLATYHGATEEALRLAADQLDALEADNLAFLKAVNAVSDLIENSEGVSGLHLNGDLAPWDELLAGGRFEEWLQDFSEIKAGAHPGSFLITRHAAELAAKDAEIARLRAGVGEIATWELNLFDRGDGNDWAMQQKAKELLNAK